MFKLIVIIASFMLESKEWGVYSTIFLPWHFAERIHISTPNKYEYQYVKKPAKVMHVQVAIKSHNDAHIALSPSAHDSTEIVEIVLGGRQNSRSWISQGKMGEPVASAPTPGILSWDEFRSFWISWRGGGVQVTYTWKRSRSSLYAEYASCVGPPKHLGALLLSKML